MTDLVVRTYLQELTAAFLENGFADIRDKRKEAGLVTPDCLLWRECLSEAGLGEDCAVTERYEDVYAAADSRRLSCPIIMEH